MKSQIYMCESNSQLFNEKYLISIIVFLVTCIIYYKNIENFINSSVKKEEKVEEKEKDWDIWTEETRYKEKDVNKWYYYVLGDLVYRYKGEWANGLANGKGVKEYFGSSDNSHSILKCNFVDGWANGYGTQTYDITADHERFAPYYEGEFKNGNQHGNGTYYYGDGCYRKGNLVKNKFEGNGIYYDSYKKRTWVGTYIDDIRDIDNGVWIKGKVSLEDAFKDKINETIEIKIR